MPNKLIRTLKDEFRWWYGAISVEELMSNSDLIELIKRIERYFLKSETIIQNKKKMPFLKASNSPS